MADQNSPKPVWLQEIPKRPPQEQPSKPQPKPRRAPREEDEYDDGLYEEEQAPAPKRRREPHPQPRRRRPEPEYEEEEYDEEEEYEEERPRIERPVGNPYLDKDDKESQEVRKQKRLSWSSERQPRREQQYPTGVKPREIPPALQTLPTQKKNRLGTLFFIIGFIVCVFGALVSIMAQYYESTMPPGIVDQIGRIQFILIFFALMIQFLYLERR